MIRKIIHSNNSCTAKSTPAAFGEGYLPWQACASNSYLLRQRLPQWRMRVRGCTAAFYWGCQWLCFQENFGKKISQLIVKTIIVESV